MASSARPTRSGAPSEVVSALVPAGRARALLLEATGTADPAERFRLAHLAALRTCAAVFAERGRPAAARRRLVSAWVLLRVVAPEFAHWSDHFAATVDTRAAVETGSRRLVPADTADAELRAAEQFLTAVEHALGMGAAGPLLVAPLAS